MGSHLASESRTRCSVRLRPVYDLVQLGINGGLVLIIGATVDADIIRDADKFKMDLIGGLERTLHGQVKPSMALSPLDSFPPTRSFNSAC